MSNFSEWEFLIDGDFQEFSQKASTIGSYYLNIHGGIDDWNDCRNDDFRMTSLFFENQSDPEVVWQLGHELISLFNGASILFKKNYHKTSISQLLHNGRPVGYAESRNQISLLDLRPDFEQARIDKEYANGAISCIKFPLIHWATENKDVYLILKYLDMESNWTTYFNLREALMTFAKEKNVDLGMCDIADNSFRNTANNFSLSGLASRHGYKENKKQNKTSPMTMDEGHKFVTNLAFNYIKTLYFPVLKK